MIRSPGRGERQLRITCLQHVSFEGPGNIAHWAATNGHSLETIRLFDGQPLPYTDESDLLVVMGGPMSVHDEAVFDWLAPEKRLIERCLHKDKFVLGVCLGSQMLAESFGGRVYRNRVKEIGWFPIRFRPEAARSGYFAGMPEQMHVLHWHGETYDPPPGCVHLAESAGCLVQAFEHPSALGLQFHLEATHQGLKELIRNCGHEIGTGVYEQSSDQIVAGERLYREAAMSTLFAVMDSIERRIGSGDRYPPTVR
jgi:GMP synthase (glutamine-hydrolysing)